jgi:SHS2 domain-containing protein
MTHRYEEHTSEVSLCIVASTLNALYVETVVAIAELMVDDASRPADGEPVPVSLRATDAPALLVDLINEIVFHSETKKQVFSNAHFDVATETELVGTLRGFSADALRTAVKAATYHEVAVQHAADGWHARVVLDV